MSTNIEEKEKEKQQEPNEYAKQWAKEMNTISIANMKKLVMMDQYTIADKTYSIRMLKPRMIIEINKLQEEINKLGMDWTEEKFNLVKQQANILLNGWDDSHFDDTDLGMLEQVIAAGIMRTKGFRPV